VNKSRAATLGELWLSCDPDTKKSGFAYWVGFTLEGVQLLPTFARETKRLRVPAFKELAIEKPQVYPGPQKTDANDLIEVALAAGWIANAVPDDCEVTFYLPRKWKKQVAKPIHHDRVWERLTSTEQALLPDNARSYIDQGLRGGAYAAQVTELLDAVGIGLVHCGRMPAGG
jgi:hypothetical protein